VTASPKTFDITRKPWIDLTKAPSEEIWQAIEACPSKALTCLYTHGIKIVLEPEHNRSIAYDGEVQVGECDYRDTAEGREIYHTEVDPAYGGKGIAKRLVYKVIESADREGKTIIPTCSYALKVVSE
jgi:predicted GNAT family acetyltransferase